MSFVIGIIRRQASESTAGFLQAQGSTMSNDIERIEYEGYVIRIVHDDDPPNPRTDWDNLGTMLYTSSRYTLGDKRVSGDEIQQLIDDGGIIWLPVYAYIHSGIALNTGGFSDPWDSGQCGIIYITREDAKKEWKGFEEQYSEDRVREVLSGEVEVYSQYVSGQVYGFVVETEDGEVVTSCFGFFGDEGIETATTEAKAHVDWEVAEAERAAAANG
jgi:hypothetical protein